MFEPKKKKAIPNLQQDRMVPGENEDLRTDEVVFAPKENEELNENRHEVEYKNLYWDEYDEE